MPMELDGETVIHDPARGRAPKPWQIEACRTEECQCDETATGWKLTRPLIRGLLGTSEAFLAEHGRDLPGVQAPLRLDAGVDARGDLQQRVPLPDPRGQSKQAT